MTIAERWKKMLSSFADIKAAATEKGGSVTNCSSYAKGVRSIYSSEEYEPKYTYPPKSLIQGQNICNQLAFGLNIKEEIRQAITDGGVECGADIPLSQYGDKIRQLGVELEIIPFNIDIGEYSDSFTTQLQARGGKPPYKWQRLYGGGGLELSSDGMLSGNVAVGDGMYKMCVQVTDSTGKQIQKEGWITAHHKTLLFVRRSGNTFEYDGKPHSLEIVCYNYPEVQVTSLLYGGKKADGVTERGQYMVEIGSVSNVPKGYYRVDYNYHSTITIV